MADKNPDQIEANPNDTQAQNDPNPKPLEGEPSMEDLLKHIRNEYRNVKKAIIGSILVLNDETKGLMVRDFTIQVGDKINGNENMINLAKLCKKLERLNKLLNTSLEYIEWLLLHIEELKKVEEIIRENVQDHLLRTDTKTIAYFENTIKNISTKTAVAVPTVGWVVGGVGACVVGAAITGTTVGIHAGFISVVAILASIGIGGIVGCGVGTVAACCSGGLAAGSAIVAVIWLSRAYKIGKERKGKIREFVEMNNNLDEREVLSKLTFVSEEFRRIVRQVKDIANNDYNIEEKKNEDERQRGEAVEEYKKVYREIINDPNIQELTEEQKIKIAKRAAENACKTSLKNDLVYGNGENFEAFLRERIHVQDGNNSLGIESTGD